MSRRASFGGPLGLTRERICYSQEIGLSCMSIRLAKSALTVRAAASWKKVDSALSRRYQLRSRSYLKLRI